MKHVETTDQFILLGRKPMDFGVAKKKCHAKIGWLVSAAPAHGEPIRYTPSRSYERVIHFRLAPNTTYS
jgi:hypothetical protein